MLEDSTLLKFIQICICLLLTSLLCFFSKIKYKKRIRKKRFTERVNLLKDDIYPIDIKRKRLIEFTKEKILKISEDNPRYGLLLYFYSDYILFKKNNFENVTSKKLIDIFSNKKYW
jgi:hypothetical protein